ncbi:MAG TPA: hypothetical protein VJ455_04855 [Ignavibacteria bacterium]|nr:hypothetical protein [Ignavibacteria bacterium]
MKNTIIALSVFIISFINIISQEQEDVMINPYWYFYSDNYLDAKKTGMGFTGIAGTTDISGINHNPASLDITQKYQVGLQYTYKTNQPWLQFLNVDDLYLKHTLFSGSAGFGYKINKNFQTGLLYSNPTSLKINFGTVIVTNEFGQEISRYEAYDEYIVHSFSVPFIYNIEKLRIGINLNYSLHRRYLNFDDSLFTGKFDRFNVQGGIIVKPIKELAIGITFIPEVSGIVTGSFPNEIESEETNAIIPLRFGAGIEYIIKGNILKIAADYNYSNLSSREGLKDKHQAHFGLEYYVDKNWTVRTGFLTIPDPRDLTYNYGNPGDNYDQIFLTFGGTYKTKNIEASIGVMDSHISSGVLQNSFINGGLTFNFK